MVSEGDKIKVEKLGQENGAKVDFDEVLLVADEKSQDVKIGNPFIKGAKVIAKVLRNAREKKIDVIKYKRKVRYRRKHGHRQHFTEVLIEKVSA